MTDRLRPLRFRPLSLREIRPAGWLARQLRIQADGLSGHLHEFWPDIQDSAWIGGKAEGWERVPYWLDGVVPLAVLLDDARLKVTIKRYIDGIIERQQPDGWLGPGHDRAAGYDIWSLFLLLKILVQYHDATGDERVPAVVEKCLRRIDRQVDTSPLLCWAEFRWFEALIAIHWLHERTGEPWLLDLGTKLRAQGFGWRELAEGWPFRNKVPRDRAGLMSHVVNNAMALHAHALWWRQTGLKADRLAPDLLMAAQDRWHGSVAGVFTGDEHLAGPSPIQGTELCAVVEYMYSLEWLLAAFGKPAYGDRLERIAFNALPATFSPDMWSHQYDQQVNQAQCVIMDPPPWETNSPAANTFGLEPNYGCCTANLSQGWPKFAAHLWMRTPDDGLAAVAYAPSAVRTTVRGVGVKVELDTEYPFRSELTFRVAADTPVRFPLLLRVPDWCRDGKLRIAGGKAIRVKGGGFHRISRKWTGTTELVLSLPMKATVTRRHNGAATVERGPLVYSLRIGEEWKRINEGQPGRELPHADWEIRPTTPWNYALDLGGGNPVSSLRFEEAPVGDRPFSPEGAPVKCFVRGRQVVNWGLAGGSAQDTPVSPVKGTGQLVDMELIPYGCTNLRITEFPVLR